MAMEFEGARHADGAAPDEFDGVTSNAMIETFVRFDLVAAACALVLVVAANAATYRAGLLWIVPAAIVVQLGLLVLGLAAIRSGRRHRALAYVAVGNWLVAVVVPFALPFLWPIMVIVVLMPLVLSAPHLDLRTLALTVVGAGLTASTVAFVGLESDDGGAIPDIDDAIELVVIIGALVALVVPIALIVWQTNRLQNAALERSQRLNVELRESEGRLATSRRRVVDAADMARSELERDLHDGAQQRLVALRMRMTLLADRIDRGDLPEAPMSGLIDEVDLVVDELRDLARGIFPPVLEVHGLGEAIAATARNLPADVRANIDPAIDRVEASIERAVYFTALEALTNAAKHAPDARIEVTLVRDDDHLALEVVDDGQGFDRRTPSGSGGLANMADRVEAVGGTLDIESASGSGTRIDARFPVPSPA